MRQLQTTLFTKTRGQGLYEITHDVRRWVQESGIENGLLTLMIQHTSASLTIQENADPDVLPDLTDAMSRLVPDDQHLYRHVAEGPDDMPAHIKSALTGISLSIPVQAGEPRLGTWQGIFVFEHRTAPHGRQTALHLLGE